MVANRGFELLSYCYFLEDWWLSQKGTMLRDVNVYYHPKVLITDYFNVCKSDIMASVHSYTLENLNLLYCL